MITNDDRRLPADPSTIELPHTTHLTITMDVIPSTPNRTQKRDTPASAGHPPTRRLPTRSSATLNKVDTTVADIRADYNSLHYTEIPVPDAVKNSISRYLRRFNILYGAFDFSVDRDGGWWFLECNPNGQWGFITEATGMPIASAIADLLTGETIP